MKVKYFKIIFCLAVNKKTAVETIGYIHSALPPLPSEYIKRQGSPKKIIVHGNLQKKKFYLKI